MRRPGGRRGASAGMSVARVVDDIVDVWYRVTRSVNGRSDRSLPVYSAHIATVKGMRERKVEPEVQNAIPGTWHHI